MNKLIVIFFLVLFCSSSIATPKEVKTNKEYEIIHSSISQINKKLLELETAIIHQNEFTEKKNVNYSITDEELSKIFNKNRSELLILEKRINQLIKSKLDEQDNQLKTDIKQITDNQENIRKQFEEKTNLLEKSLSDERKHYAELLNRIKTIEHSVHNQSNDLLSITSQIKESHKNIKDRTDSIESTFAQKNEILGKKVEKTTEDSVLIRNIEYALGAILVLFVIIFALYRKNSKKTISNLNRKISSVESESQNKLAEVDTKLAEFLASKLTVNSNNQENTVDHDLVLKISDEIARMETNLNKMDKSVKGYKQLVKAIERIKKSAEDNGYEIINLIGHEYNDGMQCEAQFVNDEEIPEGKSIITGMLRMQVNYQGQMIQSPKIIVSQNI